MINLTDCHNFRRPVLTRSPGGGTLVLFYFQDRCRRLATPGRSRSGPRSPPPRDAIWMTSAKPVHRDIHTGEMGYICVHVAPPSSVFLKRRQPQAFTIFEEGHWCVVCLQNRRLRETLDWPCSEPSQVFVRFNPESSVISVSCALIKALVSADNSIVLSLLGPIESVPGGRFSSWWRGVRTLGTEGQSQGQLLGS